MRRQAHAHERPEVRRRRSVVISFRCDAWAHAGCGSHGRFDNFASVDRLRLPELRPACLSLFVGIGSGGDHRSRRFAADVAALKARGLDPAKDICGIMVESYVGWGAVFLPKDYAQAMATFARENGILLCFDEIQSGFGRTGKLFAYEHYDVQPDLICVGKGMSSSLPLSGVLGSTAVMDLPDIGSMSSTHSANPLVCAAGLATLEDIIERDGQPVGAQGPDIASGARGVAQAFPGPYRARAWQGFGGGDRVGRPEDRCARRRHGQCGVRVRHAHGSHSGSHRPREHQDGTTFTIADEALVEGVEVLGDALAQAIGD